MARYSRGVQLNDASRNSSIEQRKLNQQERNLSVRRQQRTVALKKLGFVVLGLLLLVGLYNWQSVKYDPTEIPEDYRLTVDSYFADSPLKRSKLFFSSGDLSNYVINKHSELSSFTVNSSFIGNLSFDAEQKAPAFVWEVNGQKYFGDKDGLLYEYDQTVSTDGVLLIKDSASLAVSPGDKALPSSTLEYIKQIESEQSRAGVSRAYYQVPATAREIRMYLNGKPYYIKFSLDRSVVGQIDELAQAVTYIDKANKRVNEYIDLRTQDKVFYR